VQILVTRFQNSAELLARYQTTLAYGGLFVPTRRLLKTGQSIILDIRMMDLQEPLLVRGKVAWCRRGRRRAATRAGIGVEFCASEHLKREYLLAVARGDANASTMRRHKRLPVEMEGGWRVLKHKSWHSCRIGEIGSGGAFLHTEAVLPRDTRVELELMPPGSNTKQAIEGRVAWSRSTPGAEGFGIEFRCRDVVGKLRLRELVRRLEQNPL
jgi:Tfp pilus assembly protein PilZ